MNGSLAHPSLPAQNPELAKHAQHTGKGAVTMTTAGVAAGTGSRRTVQGELAYRMGMG